MGEGFEGSFTGVPSKEQGSLNRDYMAAVLLNFHIDKVMSPLHEVRITNCETYGF